MGRIDYVKRPRRQLAASPVESRGAAPRPRPGGRDAGELRYWVDQYRALTGQIEAAQVTNHDQLRKERVNVRDLYSRRAAAAARMADLAERVLAQLG